MKDDLTGVEQALRSLKWRTPPHDALKESLRAALAQTQARRRRVFIPHALRWPLAACWLASFLFWWLTPNEQISSAPTIAQSQRQADPAELMARRKSTERLTHELLLVLEDHGSRHR